MLRSKTSEDGKIVAFKGKSAKEVFSEIYSNNFWGSRESISGSGSELAQTQVLIKELENLFRSKNIKSVLDAPCGDFNWMKEVNLAGLDYLGADIVEDLIQTNKQKYSIPGQVDFVVLDLLNDSLPKRDLVIVRDCLVHFSYADIFKAIENLKKSGCQYLLTTTFSDREKNADIITGDWRPINLQAAPFKFPDPLYHINENCTESGEQYKDKSMALWLLKSL